MSACRSCKAPVLWLANISTGKKAPIDVDPHPEGNVLLHGVATINPREAIATRYEVLSGARWAGFVEAGTPLHRSHFASCPAAAEHRQPRPEPVQETLL